MDRSIDLILDELKKSLPFEAVSYHENNQTKAFIKNDWYEWWASTVAGSLYKSEVRSVTIEPGQYIVVICRVWIGEVYHDGRGFEDLTKKSNTSLSTLVDLAEAEAFRAAFDKFQMGWHNLGKYQKLNIPLAASHRNCIKCQSALTTEDVNYLRERPHIKNDYHRHCIPSHLDR
ncbi:hypothetical protein [Cohnella phaseoli]|uniref:Uncharacterized protein n=1 Tax=Cohnella phaseoli TaxID=456490 RepID=A0A3D9JR44_9BACL|nr:hypothetical protein [Cohnella phaseoli]RED76017.1 hypothetical protein DFP98_11377 [Cohnella phaseoli]